MINVDSLSIGKDDQGGGYHPILRSLISRNLSSAFCSHTTGRPGRAEQQQGKAGLNLDKKLEGGRGQASYPPTRRSNKAQQIEFKDNIQINKHTKNKMEVMFTHFTHTSHIMQTSLSLQIIGFFFHSGQKECISYLLNIITNTGH